MVSVLGWQAQALAPDPVSAVSTYSIGKANRPLLQDRWSQMLSWALFLRWRLWQPGWCTFQGQGQRCQGSQGKSSQPLTPAESPVREDAGTSGIASKSFGREARWEMPGTLSNWLHVRPPGPRKHSKGSPEGAIYMEIVLGCCSELGRSPWLTGLFLFQPEDA